MEIVVVVALITSQFRNVSAAFNIRSGVRNLVVSGSKPLDKSGIVIAFVRRLLSPHRLPPNRFSPIY
jgi:hypothetical protein